MKKKWIMIEEKEKKRKKSIKRKTRENKKF